ncbi:MAG TPA: phosphotransferase [Burkholderiales bacterium]|nr:phosphotransferase [Burkholderiales bacterium]
MNLEWGHRGSAPLPREECLDFRQRHDFASDGAVRAHLGAALPGGGIHGWEVFNVWYFPRRLLEVVYRITCAAGDDLLVSVRFQRPGHSPAAFEKAYRTAANPAAVLHLREWEAVAWVFPEDPELGRIGSPVAASPVCSVLSGATGLNLAPAQMGWTLLSYLPGKRCTVRVRWPSAPLGFVGKLGEGAGPNHGRMLALWECRGRGFGMPQPVFCDPVAELRWESFVAGSRVEEFSGEVGFATAVERIAPGLASLHAMKLPGLAREGPERVLDRLRRKVIPRVCGALPALAPAAQAVAATLEEKLAGLPPGASCTLHGDLHTANVLVDGDATMFIDLDNLTQGDPAYDLSMLATRLILGAALGGVERELAGRMVEALPQFYRSAGGVPIPDGLYAWYIAANLAGRQAKTCVRHHAPGMAVIVPWLLAVAARTLERGRFEPAVLGD